MNTGKHHMSEKTFQMYEKALQRLSIRITILNFFKLLGRFLLRLFIGAVLLICLAHFVPELQDYIPTIYQLANFILAFFEKLFQFVFGWFL